MSNLCCVLDSSGESHIKCRDCTAEWCRGCWPIDRTHRDEHHFKSCPKSNLRKMLRWENREHSNGILWISSYE